MTILFVGSSVSDFDTSSLIADETSYTTDGRGIRAGGFSLQAMKTLDSVATGNVWLSFHRYLKIADALGSDWNLSYPVEQAYITFYDGDNNPLVYFGFDPNTGSDSTSMQGRVYLTDGTTEDLTDIVIPNLLRLLSGSVNDRFDISVTPGSGFSIYHNRELVYTYTGSVGNSASTVNGIGKFGLGGDDDYADFVYSDVVVATTDTRFMKVNSVILNTTPSADTSSASGATSSSAFIDGRRISEYDSDAYNAFDAVGEKIMFPENGTITLSPNYAIAGVVLSYRAFETGASPVTTLTPTLNISSTDYTGTGLSITTTRKNHQHVFTTNPATSSAWTESDLENISYGLTVNT